jgi:hypothetical protein
MDEEFKAYLVAFEGRLTARLTVIQAEVNDQFDLLEANLRGIGAEIMRANDTLRNMLITFGHGAGETQ